ncbi:uncharacterized calcium-binding protein At1g02270 [Exaiptasia diaphana]|uniref:Endonuclease/exonuclease/phosphatase domain-containing protein n=1 Tax=Exaiptasia diaphana TaxID=2652724 RepID=A0A913Y4M2_EXADI|nr:uncharacterized calcium-binding protein At1g02270 [Exaiptasia diaphana]KXJ22722.1 putative calcium-binding protein [Exaiptasia diaphana]
MIRFSIKFLAPILLSKMAVAAASNKVSFRCATFNILAPCYRRLEGQYSKWESSQPNLYMERLQSIIQLISQQPKLDTICLQEFWFNSDALELFENKLGDRYKIIKLKRQGEKTDGLAIFVDRSLRILATQSLRFNDYGYRVALLLHLELPDNGYEVILTTTHLSYCHNFFDQYVRMSQAQKVVDGINSYMERDDIEAPPVILCGDFNSPQENPVYKYVCQNGFTSSFKNVHGREPLVTHKDHTGQEMSVDYVFYRNSGSQTIKPISSTLIPEKYSDQTWPKEFNISDHRMLITEFEIESQSEPDT